MRSVGYLKNQPTEALFTCGFDRLRDVGVQDGSKLEEAQIEVSRHRYSQLTDGFLQMVRWPDGCIDATMERARELKSLGYG